MKNKMKDRGGQAMIMGMLALLLMYHVQEYSVLWWTMAALVAVNAMAMVIETIALVLRLVRKMRGR